MPKGLRRYQQSGDFHFITFSCYRRKPLLAEPEAKCVFEETLERVRRWYGLVVCGYVVMPEHVHLLISEPERGTLSSAIQVLKQTAARKLLPAHPVIQKTDDKRGAPTDHAHGHFWQVRYYDFNVSTDRKRIEKLKYMHRNPVERGLVKRPEDWPWSSFRHFASGVGGRVEIASGWSRPTLSPKDGDKGGAPSS